jgi:hypothetical protein
MRICLFICLFFLTGIVTANVCPDPATLGKSDRQNPHQGYKFLSGCILEGHVVLDHALIFGEQTGKILCQYDIIPLPPGMSTCSFSYKSIYSVTITPNTGWRVKHELDASTGKPSKTITFCFPSNYPTYNSNDCEFN